MEFILAIQSFFDNLGKTITTFARIVLLSKWSVKIKKQAQTKEVVILGNGPSLSKMISENSSFLNDKELACVNHFPITEYYTELKPKYYMTSAPDLWLDTIDSHFVQASNRLFSAMCDKTSWDLEFFIPFEARKYKRWQNLLVSNKHIHIYYYNNTPVESWNFLSHFLFRKNIGMPRPHNIMVPSIFNLMNLGYKKIYLFGAEHSWLKDISVNDNNEALINQKHFYDAQTSKAQTLDKRGVGARRLHEILHKFMLAFKGYFILNEYAKTEKVQILNATPNSYIDAFERITL